MHHNSHFLICTAFRVVNTQIYIMEMCEMTLKDRRNYLFPVAAHLQPPAVARSTEIADFIAAQNGSAMDASGAWEPSALLALAASLNEVPLELRR